MTSFHLVQQPCARVLQRCASPRFLKPSAAGVPCVAPELREIWVAQLLQYPNEHESAEASEKKDTLSIASLLSFCSDFVCLSDIFAVTSFSVHFASFGQTKRTFW